MGLPFLLFAVFITIWVAQCTDPNAKRRPVSGAARIADQVKL